MGWIKTNYVYEIPGIILEIPSICLRQYPGLTQLREALEAQDPDLIEIVFGHFITVIESGRYRDATLCGIHYGPERDVWKFSVLHKYFPVVELGCERDVFLLQWSVEKEWTLEKASSLKPRSLGEML